MGRQFKRVIPDNVNLRGLRSGEINPLDIACGSTKCGDDLHCFSRYMKQAEKKYGKKGVCYNCGNDSIDWERIHKKDIRDVKYVFTSLNKELIRQVFTTMRIEKIAIDEAMKLGRNNLRIQAQKQLKRRIGKYNDYKDGQQTPLGGENIINYAQHATATCCRKCLEAWYNIPKDQELTDLQLDFCTELTMFYINDKIPQLKE